MDKKNPPHCFPKISRDTLFPYKCQLQAAGIGRFILAYISSFCSTIASWSSVKKNLLERKAMLSVSVTALIWLVFVRALSTASDPSLEGTWRDWKATHGKEYALQEEESFRRAVWEDNLRMIDEHNKQADLGRHTYWLGMNHFGDSLVSPLGGQWIHALGTRIQSMRHQQQRFLPHCVTSQVDHLRSRTKKKANCGTKSFWRARNTYSLSIYAKTNKSFYAMLSSLALELLYDVL
ncbi:cathepsin S-like [Vipera latastei]